MELMRRDLRKALPSKHNRMTSWTALHRRRGHLPSTSRTDYLGGIDGYTHQPTGPVKHLAGCGGLPAHLTSPVPAQQSAAPRLLTKQQ